MSHDDVDDWLRMVHREDGAEHIHRTDIGGGLAAPVRVRCEDEICKGLLQHLASEWFQLTKEV